ncbi:DUF1648 domain-containing protein [Microbacterium oryzae]|uniref:DUF1648 domain-containing protein n=1 Tax=Microbacterium oryzae TaxID=743009 RepID=A0A6I6DNI2_9MICO|nr:DUF1648 domain-containing protein [Microbacterium oryzae]QGU26445.1 DUF1648 domain-containing protein [Microbacterium oryzae]
MTTTQTPERARAIRRFRWVGLYVPVALFALIALVQTVLLPAMPDPAATHWGPTGGPDGFGPAWTFPLMTLLVGGGSTALIAGITLAGIASPNRPISYRFITAVIWWEVGLLGIGLSSTFFAQLGLDDARDAGTALWGLGAGFLLGLALGAIAWRLSIEVPGEDEAVAPEPVPLSAGERAVWLRTATMARSGWIVLGALLGVLLVVGLVVLALDVAHLGAPSAGTWITFGSLALVAFLVGTGCVARVRVDEEGLTVRTPIGWPRVRIPREEIRSAEVVFVSPMAEYGGWGWRYGAGSGWGAVLRAGDALRVTRTNGKVFTVTVDDAETAAGLLAAMDRRTDTP